METPTGAIADIFGRKTSRILGRLFIIAYTLIMLFGTSFTHFFIAFIVCAIGWNLESGAGDALVYDSLIETGQESSYMKVNGYMEVTYQVATALALAIGGWIAMQSYDLLFSGQVIIILAAVAVATLFKETKVGRNHDRIKLGVVHTLKHQYIDSYKAIRSNKRLLYLIVLLNALGVFTTTTFFYMQIYCNRNGIQESYMGLIFAMSSVLGALGGFFAHKIEQKVKERGLLISLPIAFMLVMWGMINFSTAIFAFLIIGFLDSLLYVVYSDYINKLIDSDKRATLLSFSSMVFSFFMLFVFPIFGWLGETISIAAAFTGMAIVSTGLALANTIVINGQGKR